MGGQEFLVISGLAGTRSAIWSFILRMGNNFGEIDEHFVYYIMLGQPQMNTKITGMHRHAILAAFWHLVIKHTNYLKSAA